ncbi:alkaline phosphatase-like protein [Jaminaea rosea]|uniref:Alkaline phosphatase n=1 Tax=Jaminaea rosea TaxID=1569628 RepID=A0A316V1R2_9BASI|nr:alkaline phosphatase-like protein [Jaminaea rosea]PWN30491.1 alkaline phosphatase-like protein [Jaminaea rosea]
MDDKSTTQQWLPAYAATQPRRGRHTLLKAPLATILFVITLTTLFFRPPLSLFSHSSRRRPQQPNVIIMISDGYGPASHTMARTFYRLTHQNDSEPIPEFGWGFPLDSALVGSHRSRSSSSLITDSAAGATAFSCGKKSYNGGIAVDSEGKSCQTVFEAAKAQGYLTGVVVTSRLTDATPACFYAHAASRSQESYIASQMLEKPETGGQRTIDLAVGGGGCFFLPMGDPLSCRSDDRDLVTEATDAGWEVRLGDTMLQSIAEVGPHGEVISRGQPAKNTSSERLRALQTPRLPFLSLLSPSNTPYVVDIPADSEGKTSFPTLAELSEQALQVLSKGKMSSDSTSPRCSVWDRLRRHRRSRKSRPFMLMIEGSQIDLCQHENDAACMVREAVAYQEAAALVKEYVDELNKQGRPTLLISTSDHETGGLTLGRQLTEDYPEYAYYPERLSGVKASAGTLSARLLHFWRQEKPSEGDLREHVAAHILGGKGGLGFGEEKSGGPVTDDEVGLVVSCLREHGSATARPLDDEEGGNEPPPIDNGDDCRKAIAEVASRRAQVGWSSSGHTGVDINLYAHGYGADGLRGNIENTDVSARNVGGEGRD